MARAGNFATLVTSTGITVADTDGSRFRFGRNWRRFLLVLNDDRIRVAQESLRALLGGETLEGKAFLDIGSGSGLFSLAAIRLGAARVHSFDYDTDSVECTRELRRRYFPNRTDWQVEQGSVLDRAYMHALGMWDVVYSWGVLHHTGNMYEAFANTAPRVAQQGRLIIAIYNDQGWRSQGWWWVKRLYNANSFGRAAVLATFIPYGVTGALAVDIVRGRNPVARYASHVRGMSHLHDWVDWLGGFPFEVASRCGVEACFKAYGFSLEKLSSCGSKHGCNEFVFRKCASCS
jgi:2-polyprenyl-6-hydroxyphenyl methylase/3-demethylubiquinone-9 3-methyltransferase